ncbi:MAG: cell division protein CrgA [Propionibacteriaceae bacterium]|nr:cell division protein CrgA [Propionibacteriaceae bacterium]
MPESKVRKEAASKKAAKHKRETAEKRQTNANKFTRFSGGRDWVPWVFVPVGLIGVIWLILYYVAGNVIWGMKTLGQWNFLIGIGCIAAAFIVSVAWK